MSDKRDRSGSRDHVHRDYGTPDTPEPLSYHQPDHPNLHSETHRAWRVPLLPADECDHERTFEDWMDGLGGGVYVEQCLDCADVVETYSDEERRQRQTTATTEERTDD